MKKRLLNKKSIVTTLVLILLISNFSISYAYWASHIGGSQSNSNSTVQIGEWDYVDENLALEVATFKADHAIALALEVETVTTNDKAIVEAALTAYGLLSEAAKVQLTTEAALLINLLAEIIAFEHSEFLDFEAQPYDSGLTGTVSIHGRTWYGSGVYISNDPNFDVWNDTRSLALRMSAYFESRDLFINGIDKITLYHGALKYNNGASFAFKIDYQLQSNPGVWSTLQENGSDLIISVTSATPLTYVEIPVYITEAVNIRFIPVISNTSDYINLDDIRIYEHVVAFALEVTTFKTIYAGALALSVATVQISDKAAVQTALSAYDLLSAEAKAELMAEKALLDSLLLEIIEQQAITIATNAVMIAEDSHLQADVDAAQLLVSALANGVEKTNLQNRLDEVQDIIDAVLTFRSDHASVLSLTISTVSVSDKAAVELALLDYWSLSVSAKEKLTDEKALLDSLLIKINSEIPTETQVLTFRSDHASVLALSVSTVQISDKLAVEQALTNYELLTTAAQSELLVEKALLDSLLIETVIQEATALVIIAEASHLQVDVDEALILVNELLAGVEKTALLDRLVIVQNIINLHVAISAVIQAENSNLQIDVDLAQSLVTQLPSTTEKTSLLNRLAAVQDIIDATAAVIIAEGSHLQVDVHAAQYLVASLPNGTEKIALQNRLDIVQNIIDQATVEQAKLIIESYFNSNTVIVTRLNNNTIKANAFLLKANEIVDGLDVTIIITNTIRRNNINSTYTIEIRKGFATTTFNVDVTFERG